jgi:predicted component of type VI protein secretion system
LIHGSRHLFGRRSSTGFQTTMKAELVPENGDPPIPIMKDLTLVGRHKDCDVVIENPGLSKRHCALVKTDGLLVIRDLATTNGTKVKGQRVRWAALLPDDRISLGGYKLRVYLGSDEIPSPSEQWEARRGEPGNRAGAAQAMGSPTSAAAAPWSHASSAARGSPQPPMPLSERSPLELPAASASNGRPNAGGNPAHEEMRFELIDEDDDEIIDLE